MEKEVFEDECEYKLFIVQKTIGDGSIRVTSKMAELIPADDSVKKEDIETESLYGLEPVTY